MRSVSTVIDIAIKINNKITSHGSVSTVIDIAIKIYNKITSHALCKHSNRYSYKNK